MCIASLGRPCPNVLAGRGVEMNGHQTPPPCIYLFPRTIPDPRNNPSPAVWKIEEVRFAQELLKEFGGGSQDVTEVHIHARMRKANVERKTTFRRGGKTVAESDWTVLKRASRR